MSKSPNVVDIGSTIDCSPEELDKMRRRLEIRRNLQTEFNRLYYNPYRQVYRVAYEDPAINRYTAARASYVEYWKPNWTQFFKWSSVTLMPVALFTVILHYTRMRKILDIQTGKTRVEDRGYKVFLIGDDCVHPLMA